MLRDARSGSNALLLGHFLSTVSCDILSTPPRENSTHSGAPNGKITVVQIGNKLPHKAACVVTKYSDIALHFQSDSKARTDTLELTASLGGPIWK